MTKLYDNGDISLAYVKPAHRGSVSVNDGKAFVSILGPQYITVDVDGQLELHNTGFSAVWDENIRVVHTITIFANRMLTESERPNPDDDDVLAVRFKTLS